jgi:hypothetical protein
VLSGGRGRKVYSQNQLPADFSLDFRNLSVSIRLAQDRLVSRTALAFACRLPLSGESLPGANWFRKLGPEA